MRLCLYAEKTSRQKKLDYVQQKVRDCIVCRRYPLILEPKHVAGAYVCQLQKESGNVLFIDIGTNGEIVLSSHGRLLCCSCAAGPALEGMNISSGMRAAEGAIEDVTITESGIEWKVIGNEKPIGICGSGILAVVKELLRVRSCQKRRSIYQAK